MGIVTLRFYAELNDHLPEGVERIVERTLSNGEEVGRLIEDCEVPLQSVELIMVDGASVPADRTVVPGDRVAVYPVFETFDVASVLQLRRLPLRRTRFTVVPHLRELGRLLIDCGYDTDIGTTAMDGRVLLTTDPADLEGVTHGLVVRRGLPSRQLRHVVERLHLVPPN